MYGRGRKIAPYLFISPFFVGYAIFFLLPVIQSLLLSFYRQVGLNKAPRFIGIDNYVRLLTNDDLFIKSLTNTTYYALGSILIIVPLALLLALILHSPKLRFREFFRFLYFTPNITAGVVVGIIFGLVFEEQYGLINNSAFGAAWHRQCALAARAALGHALDHHTGRTWKWTGINAIYFMVGLQNIPPELEGSGACRWRDPLASLSGT